MATALTPRHRAVVGAVMAIVQLVGAVTAGLLFVWGGNDLLASASAAFTGVVMLVNRWYFRGWREFHQARRGKSPPHTPAL